MLRNLRPILYFAYPSCIAFYSVYGLFNHSLVFIHNRDKIPTTGAYSHSFWWQYTARNGERPTTYRFANNRRNQVANEIHIELVFGMHYIVSESISTIPDCFETTQCWAVFIANGYCAVKSPFQVKFDVWKQMLEYHKQDYHTTDDSIYNFATIVFDLSVPWVEISFQKWIQVKPFLMYEWSLCKGISKC